RGADDHASVQFADDAPVARRVRKFVRDVWVRKLRFHAARLYSCTRPHRALGLNTTNTRTPATPRQLAPTRSRSATRSPRRTHPRIRRGSVTDGFMHPTPMSSRNT